MIIGNEVKELGYSPAYIKEMGGPVKSFHASSCKMWHVPSGRARIKEKNTDTRCERVCSECLAKHRVLKRAVKTKQNLDKATKYRRTLPGSNYKWKFMSPKSKKKRASNVRDQRYRLNKKVNKFYKRTKVELPENQSRELCKLIESIEASDHGLKELDEIISEGNAYQIKKGIKAGECIKEVWRMERESFFKDQSN